MSDVFLNTLGLLCALGDTPATVATALRAGAAPGMRLRDAYLAGRTVMVGQADAPLQAITHLPQRLRSRNNQLLLTALAQIRPAVDAALRRYGADRIAIVVGSSTSGIAEGEQAMRVRVATGQFPPEFHYGQQELGSPAGCLVAELGVRGPAYVVSTACSSSARALISGARLLRGGIVDAVIAGGADSLCSFTVAGFASLESISAARCNPLSVNRCGINIGEGAALFLMSREPGPVRLEGWGERSDAHHMSAPDPRGRGAEAAMRQALDGAGLEAADIDYVNLHGTATLQNDAMESNVVARVLGLAVPTSSTKPLTGHTLGAAGAIEAGLAWLALQPENTQGWLPPHCWDGQADPALPALRVVQPGETLGRRPRYVLSNSFAFGGNNAVLILGAV